MSDNVVIESTDATGYLTSLSIATNTQYPLCSCGTYGYHSLIQHWVRRIKARVGWQRTTWGKR